MRSQRVAKDRCAVLQSARVAALQRNGEAARGVGRAGHVVAHHRQPVERGFPGGLHVDAFRCSEHSEVARLRGNERVTDRNRVRADTKGFRRAREDLLAVLDEVGVGVPVPGSADDGRAAAVERLRPRDGLRHVRHGVWVHDAVAGVAAHRQDERVAEPGVARGEAGDLVAPKERLEVGRKGKVPGEVPVDRVYVVGRRAEELGSQIVGGPGARILRAETGRLNERVTCREALGVERAVQLVREVGDEVVAGRQRGLRRRRSVHEVERVEHRGHVAHRLDQAADALLRQVDPHVAARDRRR